MIMIIKCGSRQYNVNNRDKILDNGESYVLITRSYKEGVYKCNPTVNKSLFKKLLKDGRIKLSESRYESCAKSLDLYEFVE